MEVITPQQLSSPLYDLLQGDMSVYKSQFTDTDFEKIKVALDYLTNNENLDNREKDELIANSWRIHYRVKPPTPEEFLTEKYLGRMAENVWPQVRKWFIEFFDESATYRNAVLYPFIGSGKSTTAVLINLYICTHLALMRNPKKLFNLAPSTRLGFVLASYNLSKASEVLLQPFMDLLDESEFFEKQRTVENMRKAERRYQQEDNIDKIYWTTASLNGVSAMLFSNQLYFKLVSSVPNLLGITIVCGTMTELAFFRDAGKALTLDSKIITPKGYTLMRDIKVNDDICTPSGKVSKVLSLHPQGVTDVYELTFSDGRKIKANPEHEWKVKKYENWSIKTTEELYKTMNTKQRWSIPLAQPVPFESKQHFISPYLIGLLLGDGSFRSNSICFSVGKEDKDSLQPLLEQELQTPFQLSDYTKTSYFRIRRKQRNSNVPNEYCIEIGRLGLLESRSNNKFIPQEYLFDSVDNRIALLQGLMDTDGWAGKRGEAVFSTTSPKLAEDITFIVRSLGGFASLQTRQDTRKKNYLLTHKIQISFPNNNFSIFKLTRKQSRIDNWWKIKAFNKRQTLSIVSIKIVKNEETQCITIEDDDHLFLSNDFIVVKNSDEYIMRFFNDMKRRVDSRMRLSDMGRYWGRSILDSSPNDLESPVDKYAMFDSLKDPKNYVVTGSRWKWIPGDYINPNDTFPIFKGGSGKPPLILTNTEGYSPEDILWAPKEDYQAFHDDLRKSMKDLAGIPQGSLDKIFYDYKKIDECFVDTMKSVEFCIKADARMPPHDLIWNEIQQQTQNQLFIKTERNFHYYYKPRIPRVFHIDQSVSNDMTAIAFVHVERKPLDPTRPIDLGKDVIYIVDFVVAIHPFGGRINLDAVKEFIADVYTKGGLPIIKGSYDTYQSEAAIQYLERFGLEMDRVSVDETLDPYMFLAQLIEQGNLKLGRNIFFKNNLKSLRIVPTKIAKRLQVNHTVGDVVSPADSDYNWDTSLLGYNAKDVSDAVAGAVYNAKLNLATEGSSLVQTWDTTQIIRTPDMIKQQVLAQLKMMGLGSATPPKR